MLPLFVGGMIKLNFLFFAAEVDLVQLVKSLPALDELVWNRPYFAVVQIILVLELNRLSSFTINLCGGNFGPLVLLRNVLDAAAPITKPIRLCIAHPSTWWLASHLALAVQQRHAILLQGQESCE